MAEGIDTSAYPPMGADLVAPVVGWLAHERRLCRRRTTLTVVYVRRGAVAERVRNFYRALAAAARVTRASMPFGTETPSSDRRVCA